MENITKSCIGARSPGREKFQRANKIKLRLRLKFRNRSPNESKLRRDGEKAIGN